MNDELEVVTKERDEWRQKYERTLQVLELMRADLEYWKSIAMRQA